MRRMRRESHRCETASTAPTQPAAGKCMHARRHAGTQARRHAYAAPPTVGLRGTGKRREGVEPDPADERVKGLVAV
jgi:hypothetical protein